MASHSVRLRSLLEIALSLLGLFPAFACDAEPGRAEAVHVQTIEGFAEPESVRYDPEQDVFFVSNIAGFGSVKDSIGFISRVDAGDLSRIDHFIRSGAHGTLLHAPKGMALQGDTLWVADIDVLRAFDRHTGAPLAAVDLAPVGAILLNDVAAGPDGAVYVTDSGIEMSPVGVIYSGGEKVLRVRGADHAVSLLAAGPELGHPNGISWDTAGDRWVVVGFAPFASEAYALGQDGGRTVLGRGKGRFDGVEVLGDGRLLVTAWSDSSLHLFDGAEDRQIVRNIWQAADLGVDTKRMRAAIPLALQGRVEFWNLPSR